MESEMTKTFAYLSAVFGCCLCLIGVAQAAKSTIGNAHTVVRTVTGIADEKERELVWRDDIYHNEKIVTGVESATKLIFLDQATLTLGPNSEIVLDRFVYNPNKSKGSFIMTATSGAFRFASGKMAKKSYKIHTPAATIGIRGTEFTVDVSPVDPNNQLSGVKVTIKLESGEADLTNCNGDLVTLRKQGDKAEFVWDGVSPCYSGN
jgi:hypothetical protein